MERIKDALQLARDQRQEKLPPGGTPAKLTTNKREARHADKTPKFPPADVRFTQTQIIEPSATVLADNRLIAGMTDSPIPDAYRMLRTRVMQRMKPNNWSSLAITSPTTGSGKTLTAINLAISLAMEVTQTVLLVDLDLRRPSIHRYLDYEPEFGLSDYLLNDVPLERMFFSPSIDRLVVLPGRENLQNSSEMLRSPRMLSLLEDAKTRYEDRIIVFDLPPLLAIDDALSFVPYVDAFLLVVENGVTQEDDLRRSLEMLSDAPIVGTVLNKSEPSGKHYYY